MLKSKWKEYSYTILLCISFGVVAAVWQVGGLKERKPEEVKEIFEQSVQELTDYLFVKEESYAMSEDVAGDLPMPGEVRFEKGNDTLTGEADDMTDAWDTRNAGENTNSDGDGLSDGGAHSNAESIVAGPAGSDANNVSQGEGNVPDDGAGGIAAGNEDIRNEVVNGPIFYHADESYFERALFIGDSRTVGLYEYGGLGNAEVFADSGMSIYKIFKEKFTLRSGEEVTLEQALSKYSYDKVYIMLGINELGYDFDRTVERFGEAVARIQELQPDALVFIQANLHISKGKSEESEIFNNTNINKYNEAISRFADGKQIFYLDVNPMYDDEEGYLSMEYTTDQAHILGKYYVDWVDFILQNAVKVEDL